MMRITMPLLSGRKGTPGERNGISAKGANSAAWHAVRQSRFRREMKMPILESNARHAYGARVSPFHSKMYFAAIADIDN